MEYVIILIDFINKVFSLILDDIEYLRWEAFFFLAVIFLIPFFISRYFEAILFRLILVIVGIAFLQEWNQQAILRDTNFLVGMGLITPHINYFFSFIKNTIFNIWMFIFSLYIQLKNATINTYYFFITIYYKILRFINWLKEPFIFLKIFFTSRRENKKSNNSYSKEEDFSWKNMDDEKQSFSEEQEKEFYSDSKDEYSYKDNSNSYESNNSYNSNNNYQETKDENISDEFKQFYSPSAYVVLGVNEFDNFSDIKKSYRVLVRIYHPDLNPDNIDKYTEISQNINEAYSKLKKIHK